MTNSSAASLQENLPTVNASRAQEGSGRAGTPPAGPRDKKPGRSLNSQSNTIDSRKRDALTALNIWTKMLCKNFNGIQSVSKFLQTMGTGQPVNMDEIVENASATLQATARKLGAASQERLMTEPMLKYLSKVVEKFPPTTKPSFHDTSNVKFPSVEDGDQEEHHTMPDITGTKPGESLAPGSWCWRHDATVIELKHTIDTIDERTKTIRTSVESRKALVQLAKSARSLLMTSGSCHVYIAAVFACTKARIFRFDRSGFSVTESFDFTVHTTHLPTFLWRLYNPVGYSTVTMLGADDTISTPTDPEKERMREAIHRVSFYNNEQWPDAEITDESLWIYAARYNQATGLEVVKCFTFGGILFRSDGLFGRATRVFRVILEEDADASEPTIYALKDAWPQTCRRPEADFYHFIEKYCQQQVDNASDEERGQKQTILESIAKCHGSLDLSVARHNLDHRAELHVTDPTHSDGSDLPRRHMRLLLTPVGTPLKDFKSTKSLVGALLCAVRHHQAAYNAGVIHRDVSEGNVLFREVPLPHNGFNGFLVDWDYAEFTPEGAQRFKELYPHDHINSDAVRKSLEDITGTFPFMAIEIANTSIENDGSQTPVVHGAKHDLESFYWLLVWLVLRHTSLNKNPHACANLFDFDSVKHGWIQKAPNLDKNACSPLHSLLETLRWAVQAQNRERVDLDAEDMEDGDVPTRPPPPVDLEHTGVLNWIESSLRKVPWPDADAAREYIPSLTIHEMGRKQETLRTSVHQRNLAAVSLPRDPATARSRRVSSDPVASTSGGTTAFTRGSSLKRAAPDAGADDDISPSERTADDASRALEDSRRAVTPTNTHPVDMDEIVANASATLQKKMMAILLVSALAFFL
ncbi:hypothetical protein FB45DRAFT_1023098 [Roridomyces roridus]|uniref:Fungal-type protein kinase domain-containing protein n=1 Tax=Roridomyces roridus TaxID=1738132 RepID=A0AAD7C3I5_9AGAR|nr:hypothetical protein FB45DRAFT_1023098 [Roridomyces roridus]